MTESFIRVFKNIEALIRAGRIRFTLKALIEIEVQLDLDENTATGILRDLSIEDFDSRLVSNLTDEWLYVFKPQTHVGVLYIKLVVRGHCVIVSFHEDQEGEEP